MPLTYVKNTFTAKSHEHVGLKLNNDLDRVAKPFTY